MGLARDLRRARGLSLRSWADLATATAELGLARIRLAAMQSADLIADAAGSTNSSTASRPKDKAAIERVAFAIPRMGARVPWRGTCLVQALAARRWLARLGVASEIVLGARQSDGAGLDAHAWLKAGDRIVVGGDPAAYQPFERNQQF